MMEWLITWMNPLNVANYETMMLGLPLSLVIGASLRTWWQIPILALAITIIVAAYLFASRGYFTPRIYSSLFVYYTGWSFVGYAIVKLGLLPPR